MHPLGISYNDYQKALEINKIKDTEEKALKINEWENETGNKFPWCFPNCESLGLSGEKNWERVVTDPASCMTGKIF